MTVQEGQYVTITITTDTPNGPPVNLRWLPPAGVTNLTVTLTPESPTPAVAKFKVNAVAPTS